MLLARVVLFVVGLFLVAAALLSAVRTVVVPRSEQVRLTRTTFLAVRMLFDAISRRRRTREGRDRMFARYAPVALLTLVLSWALITMAGFTLMFWSIGDGSLRDALALTGSSLTTLGFVAPENDGEMALATIEALIGLGLVALLISYLPTMYSLFSKREAEVIKLDMRAGSPPTAIEMLSRFHRIGWLGPQLDDTFRDWEDWFAEVEESHSSHPSLVFFRSQRIDSSWITGAGAVLDTAAISLSAIDIERRPEPAVVIRGGTLCLRAIAAFYGVPFDPAPAPSDPISIYRQEFDLLVDELADQGIPVVADREQAWRDFAGWRVNYDTVLLALCAMCDAPPTPWSSDRLERFHRPTLLRRRWRIEPIDTPRSW